MKILNKNKKLKYSKMFIEKEIYDKICARYGSTLKDHLNRISIGAQTEGYVPDMTDVSIMFDVYSSITKIIKPKKKKKIRYYDTKE
jgi:hypothetical protein